MKQLHRLHRRLDGVEGPYRWATFDTPQSRSLLADERVDFVRFVGGRDPVNLARNLPAARRILREHEIGTVVSTGSSMALPFFAVARARRLTCHYIESAARSEGPSITGRAMRRIPGVWLYAQYPGWAENGWHYRGSVFDSFEPTESTGPSSLRKVVVTLGTYRGYGFPRLPTRLLEILPSQVEVLWQTGDTDTRGLGIAGREAIPERELGAAIAEADVVVAHAGVGAALLALEVGKCPVLVPRRLAQGEHVDDHQIQIATELGERGLAISVDASELTLDHLLIAAGDRVVAVPEEPRFVTCGAGRPADDAAPIARAEEVAGL